MKLNTQNLADVELGFPVFAEGNYHVKLKAVKIEPNKSKDGNNLLVEVVLTDPELVTHSGKVLVNKGKYALTRYISLKPTDKYSPDQNLKELALALKLDITQDLTLEALQEVVGTPFNVKLSYRAPEGSYKESNDLDRFSPRPDEDLHDDSAIG